MQSYSFSTNTRTYFGSGCLEKSLTQESEIIGSKPMIISTGRSLNRLGYMELIRRILEKNGCDTIVYDSISADPDITEVRDAIQIGRRSNVSSVIGFGGGSAIDAAKATALGILADREIEDYLLDDKNVQDKALPIIAVPTTAGTGTELSKGAIISSRKEGYKKGVRGEALIPTVAIIDPEFTSSIPYNITMETGFDAFAHAAESFCSINSNPFSEMLSEKTIRIVGEALNRLNNNLDDYGAREMMSFAAHIIGHNVRDIGNCLPHRLQYPVGSTTYTSHGAGLIALYPAWIDYEYRVNPNKVTILLDWLGCRENTSAKQRIVEWIEKIGIARSLSGLGVVGPIEDLTNSVSGNIYNDKLADVPNIVTILYEESM